MRIVQANAVYDPAFTTPDDLLDAYHSLTEWSVAMSGADADVSVVQRFRSNTTLVRDGITYQFVADREAPWLSATAAPQYHAATATCTERLAACRPMPSEP